MCICAFNLSCKKSRHTACTYNETNTIPTTTTNTTTTTGAWGSVVVKALRYWSDGPGIDYRWCRWGFFRDSDEIKCPGVDSAPENEYQGFLSWGKGGRCVWLMTYHIRSAKRQEYPGS